MRRNLGLVNGGMRVYERLTGREVLEFFAGFYGLKGRAFLGALDWVVDLLEMEETLDKKVGEMSTGMRQKVVIARAILHRPKVLLLDEATAGLDIFARRALLDFVKAYRDLGHAVIYSTHVMGEAEEVADRVGFLHRGRLVYEGSKEEALALGEGSLERAFVRQVRGLDGGGASAIPQGANPGFSRPKAPLLYLGSARPADAGLHVRAQPLPKPAPAGSGGKGPGGGGGGASRRGPKSPRGRPAQARAGAGPRRGGAGRPFPGRGGVPGRSLPRFRPPGLGFGGKPGGRGEGQGGPPGPQGGPGGRGPGAGGSPQGDPLPLRRGGGGRLPPKEKAGGLLGFLLPFFLVVFVLSGGQVVAVDATAGEKEKGTLEALLAAPVPLVQVALGKTLATVAMALLSGVAGLLGLALGGAWSARFGGGVLTERGETLALGGQVSLDGGSFLALFLTAFLLALFMGAVMVALGLYARSFKEAQSYMAPLQLLFLLPLLFLQFRGFLEIEAWHYLLPLFNVALLMDALLKGSATPLEVGLTWASTLVYALLALGLAVWVFGREDVVFRN